MAKSEVEGEAKLRITCQNKISLKEKCRRKLVVGFRHAHSSSESFANKKHEAVIPAH
jgi:hypothetical protein